MIHSTPMTFATNFADVRRALEIDGWMTHDELMWLGLQAMTATNILELGSWCGRSTRALADNTLGQVTCVDQWQGIEGLESLHPEVTVAESPQLLEFQRVMADHLETGKVKTYRSSTLEFLRRCNETSDYERYDLIFLDDDHSYDHVLEEIRLARGLLTPGGILSGHDYWSPNHPGVTRAVDATFPVNHIASIWWIRL